MNKIKPFRFPIYLALLGIGILLLGAWDMQRVTAAPRPEAWTQGTDLPLPDTFYGSAQCQGDPHGFYVVAGWQAWFDNRDEVWHYDAATSVWTPLAPYPEEMGAVSVTCYQGFLYGAGGNLEGWGTSDAFYRYDIDADIWTQLADLPRPQNGAALVAWDGYLYMIGGDDAAVVPLSPTTQVDRYNLQMGIWEMNWGTPMPVEVIASWLQSGRYVYFVGGYTSVFPINSDTTLRYDLVTNTWEASPSFASRRAMTDLVITSQYLYAIGGDANLGGSADETDLVERLDLSLWPGGDWVDTGDPLPEPRMASRGFCSEAMAGGEIWSVGGGGTSDEPTIETYYRPSEACADLYFGDWAEAEPIPFGVAFYGSAQCPDQPNSFYVISGAYDWGVATNNVWRYDADTDTWNALAPVSWPEIAPAAVCYAGRIYLVANQLQIYDIESDIWTNMGAAPRLLYGSAMGVWDGKLYRIGGSTGDFYIAFDDVDVYDIASGQWELDGGTPMPVAVFAPAFTQIGPYLYVVGGNGTDSPIHNVNLIQRYDMATDTWEQIDFPSARGMGFALAYSGNTLYAIGGDLDGNYYYEETGMVETLDLETWPDCAWEMYDDPLPYSTIGNSAGFCTEAVTGGEIWSIAGSTIDPDMIFDYNYYHPTGEPCVYYGVDLPDPWEGVGEAGETVTYTLSITNTGVVTDYYTMEVSTTWNIKTSLGGHGPIGPGESLQIALAMDVPPDAMWGDLGVTEITAASISNSAAFDTTSITTTVLGYEFELNPPSNQEGYPGDVLTYILPVSNIGDFEDGYNVDVSGTWETVSPLTFGPLAPGADAELIIMVTVPADAPPGVQDAAVVTLTSQADPRVSHEITLTSTAIWHRTLMPFILKN